MKLRRQTVFNFLICLASLVIMVSRRPDALTNPQFWAEDGATWYAQAYNLGPLASVILPRGGYFQSVSRSTAAVVQFFPLIYGPLIFNLVAIFIQFLPILLIFSTRFDKFIPSLPVKIFIVLVYLAMPNTSEVYLNLTNCQWYLALAGAMVLLSSTPPGIWRQLDSIILFLSGLSGPFSIFWLPIVFLGRHKLPRQLSRRKLLIIVATGVIQLVALLTSSRGKLSLPPGSIPQLFFTILSRQIIWGALVGPNGYTWILDKIPWYPLFFVATTFLALLVILYALIKAPIELKIFVLFAGLNLLAGLITPTMIAGGNKSAWQVLSETSGIRYWLIPMIGFLVILFWTTKKINPLPIRLTAIFFWSCMILFGIKNYRQAVNWRYPSYLDFHYSEEVDKFLKLSKGESLSIPINPTGWTMALIRK